MESPHEQGARLEELLKQLRFKQLSFAKAVGLSQGFIAQVINGRKNISYGFQTKILNAFPEVNLNWLMTGEGEMLLEKKTGSLRVEEVLPQTLSEPETEYVLVERAAPVEESQLVVMDVTPLAGLLDGLRKELDELRARVAALEKKDGDRADEP